MTSGGIRGKPSGLRAELQTLQHLKLKSFEHKSEAYVSER
jgi:hypothetical protein